MDWWRKLYLYEVEFKDGFAILQPENDRPMLKDAAAEHKKAHGPVVELRLMPQQTGLRAHSVRIPTGMRPVYFRRDDPICVGKLPKGLRFCIGWTPDNANPKAMICLAVSAKTGDTLLMEPENYNGH